MTEQSAPAPGGVAGLSGAEARALIRAGRWRQTTAGMAVGWEQANLVILPAALADDFHRFCEANPRACPLLDITAPGSPEPRGVAPGADLRVDVPRYRVYRRGALAEEVNDLYQYWRPDFVGFLLGCSYTADAALLRGGVPLRYIEQGTAVGMYRSTRACRPVGPFHGPLVVSMRPIPAALVDQARRITARQVRAHGAPVHVGDPAELGIADLAQPDYGDPLPVAPGEVPMFWACGVTPQAAAEAAGIELMITHAPGHMFVTDMKGEDPADG